MTAYSPGPPPAAPPPPPVVRCPMCLDRYPWPADAQFYEYKDGLYSAPGGKPSGDALKQDMVLRSTYVKCPNPSNDLAAHFLPARYATFGEPLVIGLVGASSAGKSHLLAAMMGAIDVGLESFGANVQPLDFRQHTAFLNDSVSKLHAGNRLPSTLAQANAVSYSEAQLIATAEKTWPVTFFDVAGGDLAEYTGNATRFLEAAGAFVFVVDPDKALAPSHERERREPAFAAVLDKLGQGKRFIDKPTALVMSKADRYRFRSPVDRWLDRAPSRRVDAELIRQESRDVYGFLYQHGSAPWLRPFDVCRRSTLHFASATGGDALDTKFPRGVRPKRVLEPLIALLAMCGVIPGPESEKVGIW